GQRPADGLRAPLDQVVLGDDQQRAEQHQERQGGRQRGDGAGGVEELGQQGGGDTDDQPPDVGDRQAGEASDGGGAVGVEDQQGEEEGVEAQRWRQDHAGDGGERRADEPGEAADPDGV